MTSVILEKNTADKNTVDKNTAEKTQSLALAWQQLLNEKKLRIRDAAVELGVSEAELLATRLGDGVTRLNSDCKKILSEIEALGTVMALTRNEAMVHEKTGQYKNLSIHGNMGLALGVIDLRIFFSRFVHAFFVEDTLADGGVRRSLQFFNAQGEAVHKIYARQGTDQLELEQLVERHRSDDQGPLTVEPKAALKDLTLAPAEIDLTQLKQDWSELKDVHHFQAMLKKHSLERIPAYRVVGEEYAARLSNDSFEKVLTQASEEKMPIMVFVGSEGLVQIHTGEVNTLKRLGPWFNVLDSEFNLHANTDLIDQAWVVRKPTSDGVITSLEVFDQHGQQLALLFGERENGQPEMQRWRDLVEAVSQQCELTD